MKLSKRNIIYGVTGLCGVVVILIVSMSVFGARRTLKSQCVPGGGMDCRCLANVIDNRLNKQEVRAFARFSKELRVRQNANILEFTDEVTARNISMALSVCRPVQQVQQETKNQKGKK